MFQPYDTRYEYEIYLSSTERTVRQKLAVKVQLVEMSTMLARAC
jgi:hypothetical protein